MYALQQGQVLVHYNKDKDKSNWINYCLMSFLPDLASINIETVQQRHLPVSSIQGSLQQDQDHECTSTLNEPENIHSGVNTILHLEQCFLLHQNLAMLYLISIIVIDRTRIILLIWCFYMCVCVMYLQPDSI